MKCSQKVSNLSCVWINLHNKSYVTLEHHHLTGAVKTWCMFPWRMIRATLSVRMVRVAPDSEWKCPRSGQLPACVLMNTLWWLCLERMSGTHRRPPMMLKLTRALVAICGLKTPASFYTKAGELKWLIRISNVWSTSWWTGTNAIHGPHCIR